MGSGKAPAAPPRVGAGPPPIPRKASAAETGRSGPPAAPPDSHRAGRGESPTTARRGAAGAKATEPPVPPNPPRIRPKPIRPAEFVWAFPPEPPFEDEARPLLHAPAVDAQGRVFLHHGDRLVALEPRDEGPKVLWEYVTGCHVPGPVALAPDGSLRLHGTDGSVHAVSDSGRQVWSPVHVGEPLGYATPSIDAAGNTYISSKDGGLHRIDADGRLAKPAPWFRTRQQLNAGSIIRDGVLYVGSEDGYLFAIALGGARGENLFDHALERGHAGWYIHSRPALAADGTILLAGSDEHLYGFAPDGRTLWRTRLAGLMLGSPVVDRQGHIYIGVSLFQRGQQPRGWLVSIDGNSHKVRWEYPARDAVESTPAIGDDDVIYFGDNAGVIHAVDCRGQMRWTAQVEAAARSSLVIIAPERLAVGLDDQTLVVLRCSSQSLATEGWPKAAKTLAQNGLA